MSICIAAYLLLLTVSISALPHSLEQVESEQFTNILSQTFSKCKHSSGYSECIAGSPGIVRLERVAGDEGQYLRLYELTNGSVIVQLIFTSQHTLSDCDVSNSRHHIHQLLKHVTSKNEQDAFQPTEFDNDRNIYYIQNLRKMDNWIQRCNNLHAKELGINTQKEDKSTIVKYEVGRRISIEGSVVKLQSTSDVNVSSKRVKRGFMDLLYPGTKWCGKGNSSKHYYDLGDKKHTDRCCRTHDYCKNTIPAFTTKYNYFNFGLMTLSSCECDRKFRKCLQKASRNFHDELANLIGHLYFNVIGLTCFNLEEQSVCTESSFWGHCLKHEPQTSAVFNEYFSY